MPVLAQTNSAGSGNLLGPGMAIDRATSSTGQFATSTETSADSVLDNYNRFGSYERAIVKKIVSENVQTQDGAIQQLRYTIEILSGDFKDQWHTFTLSALTASRNLQPQEGDNIVVFIQPDGQNSPKIFLESYDRRNIIIIGLIILFLLLIVIAGGKGLKAMLITALAIFLSIYIPLPLFARNWPVVLIIFLYALALSASIALILHGWSKKTLATVLGTTITAAITSLLTSYFVSAANITGTLSAASTRFFTDNPMLNPQQLIIIGLTAAAFAIILDITVSISCAVQELKNLKSNSGFKELFASGMQIGGEHLLTMSLILPLALLGTSIFIFLARYQNTPWIQFINQNETSFLIILSIAGFIGIIISIPVTAAFSALLHSPRVKKDDRLRKAMRWDNN